MRVTVSTCLGLAIVCSLLLAAAGCGGGGGKAPDTGPPDTGPADTGPADTGPADTGPADTGPADTGPADTGPPPERGNVLQPSGGSGEMVGDGFRLRLNVGAPAPYDQTSSPDHVLHTGANALPRSVAGVP